MSANLDSGKAEEAVGSNGKEAEGSLITDSKSVNDDQQRDVVSLNSGEPKKEGRKEVSQHLQPIGVQNEPTGPSSSGQPFTKKRPDVSVKANEGLNRVSADIINELEGSDPLFETNVRIDPEPLKSPAECGKNVTKPSDLDGSDPLFDTPPSVARKATSIDAMPSSGMKTPPGVLKNKFLQIRIKLTNFPIMYWYIKQVKLCLTTTSRDKATLSKTGLIC